MKFSSGLENYKHHETTIDKVCVLIFLFVFSSHLSLNKIKSEFFFSFIECPMCRMYCWHAIIWLLLNILCREMYTFLHHKLFVCVLQFFVLYIYLFTRLGYFAVHITNCVHIHRWNNIVLILLCRHIRANDAIKMG